MPDLDDLVLLPRPKLVEPLPGSFSHSPGEPLVPIGRIDPSAGLSPQGYQLVVAPGQLELTAHDEAGAFYGQMTLRQLLRHCDLGLLSELPACRITDYPDFLVRGVMLDISRDKVPTLKTLLDLVDTLAEWKVNHLELYMEHTFAYPGHEQVWQNAGPMTGDDIRLLDEHCRVRHIELVPNQNSFGHMHRWLRHHDYRHLAECPGEGELSGVGKIPWDLGSTHLPWSLDPTSPDSLRFLAGLYDDLLPHFTSRRFNVGCDETFDLGWCRSREACAQRGRGRVYLDFLLGIHRLVRERGFTMHYWADMVSAHPELMPDLPHDAVALVWGYEDDFDFAQACVPFADHGYEFYVCPGTSSWNSVSGRSANCLANQRNAASGGLELGASGYLNTDWGDRGHWQYLPISYLGLAAGAALSWSARFSASTKEVSRGVIAALDFHLFEYPGGGMAAALRDLGDAYLHTGHLERNRTVLFRMLQSSDLSFLPDSVTAKTLEETKDAVGAAAEAAAGARLRRRDASLIKDEIANAALMLTHACDRGIAYRKARLGSSSVRAELDRQAADILAEHRRLWLSRNRPGGLTDSLARFKKCW